MLLRIAIALIVFFCTVSSFARDFNSFNTKFKKQEALLIKLNGLGVNTPELTCASLELIKEMEQGFSDNLDYYAKLSLKSRNLVLKTRQEQEAMWVAYRINNINYCPLKWLMSAKQYKN